MRRQLFRTNASREGTPGVATRCSEANWGGICGGRRPVSGVRRGRLVGVAASLGRRQCTDLLVAGRAMPFWMATITMAATWIDGGYLLGTAEGVFTSLASGWQGGVCFGLSLVLGGLFFARRMRQLEFVTLIDPLAARFGKHWSAVLSLPALLGEVLWSAELLVAIGATFGVMLGMDLTASILVSAAVVTCYTMLGGMWSVGYTDIVQFCSDSASGCSWRCRFALDAVGGLDACWSYYVEQQGERRGASFRRSSAEGYWTAPRIVGWWDLSIMLALGGIPWNCYFQRSAVLPNARSRREWHSITAGLLTIVLDDSAVVARSGGVRLSRLERRRPAQQLHDVANHGPAAAVGRCDCRRWWRSSD